MLFLADSESAAPGIVLGDDAPSPHHSGWLKVLREGLQHQTYQLEVTRDGRRVGVLPLALVRSILFGRFLVSLPYLNYGGVLADDEEAARELIDRAVKLADKLNVRFLELRHEHAIEHPALQRAATDRLNMRMALPKTEQQLWGQLRSKVRNQVRKAQSNGLIVTWGGQELLGDFYGVFSRNMRDLGTPVYSRRLFENILEQFAGHAELCVVRQQKQPIAAALLIHDRQRTEVPSASSLRAMNHTNANMLMYWHLLVRAVERGQQVFDFGRCRPDSTTFRFKQQWGATAQPAAWQYYLRRGRPGDVQRGNGRLQLFINIWRRLPLEFTRICGPAIVRGIP